MDELFHTDSWYFIDDKNTKIPLQYSHRWFIFCCRGVPPYIKYVKLFCFVWQISYLCMCF